MLATANTKKTRERFGTNEDEWTGKVELTSRKKCLAVGEAGMTIF